ncbi:MAG: hypothetical protein ABL911_03035 [Gallionella sp.]
MGFQFGEKCYPDAVTALNGWLEQFPTKPDSTGAMWYVNAATQTSTATFMTITGTLKKSTGVATATTAITGVRLPVCTQDVVNRVLDKYPVQDINFAIALTIVVFIGFVSGRLR